MKKPLTTRQKDAIVILATLICALLFIVARLISEIFSKNGGAVVAIVLVACVIGHPVLVRKVGCSTRGAWLSVVAVTLALILGMFGSRYAIDQYRAEFSPKKWKNTNFNERYYMVEDLAEEYELIGMTKVEVAALLGTPSMPFVDAEGADVLEYYVGDYTIDPGILSFVFEDGAVVEVYYYTEQRENKTVLCERK